MDADLVDAIAEAATDGIAFDGFEARTDGEQHVLRAEDRETTTRDSGLRDAVMEYAEHATNWYFWHAMAPQADDRWAFLRWIERAPDRPVPDRYETLADGCTREWGELAITATVDPETGARSYDLRHVDDRRADVGDPDADAGDLDTYRDPLDVRNLVKYDDRGRYRPLKTAPTLPTGWAFPDLAADDLVRAVDFAYPATVANWHREREDELDVSHWHETIGRQTGIYGVVKTWDRQEGHDHVNRVAETCCEDSQCLKRREWEYDEDTDLDVDGGDGTFPCREPCSLVIAAARTWTKLEGEESRTYEFELTPSEKEQVEAIVEAVADGRTEQIREADLSDPANRYRARYLRAKRLENGDLGGVRTDPDADGESSGEASDAGGGS